MVNLKIIPYHQKVLNEAGGCICRLQTKFFDNKVQFNYIKPPMISHIAQIEDIKNQKISC